MKNIIIIILVVLLGTSLYTNFNSKKNTDPKISMVAVANYDQGHIVGGNSQYFDLTFTSDTDIGAASIVFTQSSSAVVPNPVSQISEVQKDIVIKKGNTKINKVLLAQITKITVNGKSVPFTQTY
jgi:hypothetical protein